MKQIIFEVTKYKKTKILFPIEITRKYPVHSHYLLQQEKNKVVYKYDPASNLNEEEYKKYLQKYLIQKNSSISNKATVTILNNITIL